MLSLHNPDEQIVAILHDIVEDCNVEVSALKAWGFSEKIVDAIDSISKRDNESNAEYIQRVKRNKIATAVKIADISDNLSPMRQYKLSEKTQKRLKKKYLKGLKELLEE
jgi:(p)ppGpp synthase/HD superfamily hydrolase